MRIVVDGRRLWDGSGIGRVTELILDVLHEIGRDEVIVFTWPKNELAPRWKGASKVNVDVPLFSPRDLHELPRLIESQRADVFIAPQFYVSPLTKTPTVRFIHDMWPVFRPDWLPTVEDMVSSFGEDSREGMLSAISHFEEAYARGEIFPDNSYLKGRLPVVRRNLPGLYSVAVIATVARLSERIVTVSEYAKTEIVTILPEVSQKVDVVHNFVADNLMRRQADKAPRRGVLHVSKLDPRKNHQGLLRALQIVRSETGLNLLLTVAGGTGFRKYSKEITEIFRKEPSVRFVGHVRDDDILFDLYKEAQLFVFPSFHEGFGIPVLEAMTCGAPVIASNTTALPEVCGDAALLINPHDEREIADAILAVLESSSLENRLREAGLKRAKAYSKEKSTARMAEVLKQL